jgi:hypothetical protein
MLLKKIWSDQTGSVASMDLILITTILALGTVVGLATYRNSVVQELGDLAAALGSLNQSYQFTGSTYDDGAGFTVETPGSDYTDETDFCDGPDVAGQPPAGIDVLVLPSSEGT